MKILLPLAWIYGGVMALRNWLFNHGQLRQTTFDLPIISVGNLAVGGTGKTPHSEYLLKFLLHSGKKCVLLSRGYGRPTKGFYEAKGNSAREVGDEPWQMQCKFPEARICVCEKRVVGIEEILKREIPADVIILDDAYQHRYVKPGLSILLTDYARPYYSDEVMPAGRLREFSCGARRADLIIVTKCPAILKQAEEEEIIKKLQPLPHQKVFFTRFDYGQRYAFQNKETEDLEHCKKERVLLLCGIAKPQMLLQYLQTQYADVHLEEFRDHHNFTKAEIDLLNQKAQKYNKVVTTEKDAARLSSYQLPATLSERLWIQPIEVTFLNHTSNQFNQIISNYVTENSRNRTVD